MPSTTQASSQDHLTAAWFSGRQGTEAAFTTVALSSSLSQFIILMLGMLTVIGTLLSDILLAAVDPRIRYTGR